MHCTTLDFVQARALPSSERTNGRSLLLLVHIALTISLAAAGLLCPVLNLDSGELVYPACLVLTLSFALILPTSQSLPGPLSAPYTPFLIPPGLFHSPPPTLPPSHS